MKDKKLWYWARGTFYTSIFFWIIVMFTELSLLFSFVWILTSFAALILAILHLPTYKEKGFAITSVVLMGLVSLLFLVGMWIGIMGY